MDPGASVNGSIASVSAATAASPSTPPDPTEWALAVQVLREMLARDGCVSSKALRTALDHKGIPNARAMVVRLRYFDFDAPPDSVEKELFLERYRRSFEQAGVLAPWRSTISDIR
jgi:hypothetical protein